MNGLISISYACIRMFWGEKKADPQIETYTHSHHPDFHFKSHFFCIKIKLCGLCTFTSIAHH